MSEYVLALATALILGSGPLLAASAMAQSDSPPPETIQPGTTSEKTLGENPNAANVTNEVTGTAGNLLSVPLVRITPGGVPIPKVESPVANDSSAAERGMNYFINFNCVGCHATNGGGGMGISLSNSAFKFGADPGQIYNVIAHGAPFGMPAWGTVLPNSAIWDIVAYIQSISKSPSGSWGTTVNATEHAPAIEQVPAEFQHTSTPWQHTQPFSNGQKPTNHNPTSTGVGAQPPKAQ